MSDPKAVAHCKPCKNDMEHIIKESMGDCYWCRMCGTIVELSYSNLPSITVDKCPHKHSPAPEIMRENNDH